MSWFEEQIKQRTENDDAMLESALSDSANALLGSRFSLNGDYPETTIGQILRFHNLPNINCPDSIKDADKRLEYVFRSSGLMHREVNLTDDWYNSCCGAMMATLKDNGKTVAVLPDKANHYTYFEPTSKKYIPITKKNANVFNERAICFYKPFPQRSMTKKDFIKYCLSTWSKTDVALSIAFLILATLMGLLTPKINHFLFANALESTDYSWLLSTLLFAVCVSFSATFFHAAKSLVNSRIGTKMSVFTEAATMMRVMTLPQSFFTKYSAGDISRRIEYVKSFCDEIVEAVFGTLLTSIFSLAYISQIILFAPVLTTTALIVIITTIVFSLISAIYQFKICTRRMHLEAKNNGLVYSTISGIQKIKVAGAEKRMFARYATDYSNVARAQYNPPLIIKLNTVIPLLISLIGQFAIYYLASKNNIAVADYYAFATSYGIIVGGLATFAEVILSIAQSASYISLAKPILETAPEMNDSQKQVVSLKGGIELERVSFRYNENSPYVINNLSLKIRSGQYVAIVGKSGCGKSTLAKIMLGFAQPEKGAVYYDGTELSKLDKSTLRRNIGVVVQGDKLFNGSIYSNIVVCEPKLTLDEAWEIARIAGIDKDIESMPMGMHTVVAEGSGGFSGGQSQRLMIARAIAPKPKILIFDEATSALDNKTQKQVSDSLAALKCTRIVIAHRLSTIKDCDRILVMDNGSIIDEGTYDYLLENNSFFAELVEHQRLD